MAFWKKFAEKQRANFTISDVLTIHLKEDVVRAVFAGKIVELFEFAPTKKTVHFRREYTLPGKNCLLKTVALGDYKVNFLFSCLAVDRGSFSGKSYKNLQLPSQYADLFYDYKYLKILIELLRHCFTCKNSILTC